MAAKPVTYPYVQYDCYRVSFHPNIVGKLKACQMMVYATTLLGHTEGTHPVKVGPKSDYIVYVSFTAGLCLPAGTANPLNSSDSGFQGATIGREDCSPYPTEPMSDQVEAC
ncbi:hypothetical protein LTR97_011282 [Elasticomyces elasticus]|uniref:Uncharacterized protein n=1 Tax=Elasticomyces elasticus TaxID=574655 RepID=A0AAN7VYX3_9PEZI|nr:hypothetical protein LTR97_011282 [Elasticomyces elasticus]